MRKALATLPWVEQETVQTDVPTREVRFNVKDKAAWSEADVKKAQTITFSGSPCGRLSDARRVVRQVKHGSILYQRKAGTAICKIRDACTVERLGLCEIIRRCGRRLMRMTSTAFHFESPAADAFSGNRRDFTPENQLFSALKIQPITNRQTLHPPENSDALAAGFSRTGYS